jgi:Spy/CpxP family protein refolding chaperone
MFNSKLIKTLLIASTVIGLPAMADTANTGIEKTQVKVGSEQCARANFGARKAFKTEKRLGLSDSQLEQVAALKDKNRTETAGQKAQLKTLSDQLKLVITKPEINQSEAMQIQSKINDLRSQLSNERLQERMNFMSILTPEQRESLRHRMLVSEAFSFGGAHRMHHHFGNRA